MRPRWNGAPTQDYAACRVNAEGARSISRLRCGLIPFWAKDVKIGSRLINARAETVDSKPAFRSAFESRRCLYHPRSLALASRRIAQPFK